MSDLLFEIPQNPVPEGAVAGMMTARDGVRLRYARFAATGRPLKGTVVILQGRNECIEKYFETARDLAARGFATAAMDWRGQGGSGRLLRDPRRGHVKSFDAYVRDLDSFFQEVVLPDCRPPHNILAHSTGGLVALLASPHLANRVRRMVLCSPLVQFAGLPSSMAALRRLSGFLYALGLGRFYMTRGARPDEAAPFEGNSLTSDPVRYARNQELYARHPDLAIGGPTVAWVRAACRAAARIQDPGFAAGLRIPSLFVAAGADTVVSTPAVERYATALRPGSLVTIDGARHEILQEADIYREQLLAAFDAFVPGTGEVLV